MEEEGKKEEEEARAKHCREMISLVRSRQQHLQSSAEGSRRKLAHKGGGGRRRSDRDQNSPGLKCQGPEVQPAPPQLVSLLRLKTFKEQMRRAAEVELHDPAVCGVCEQEQASLALKSFIRRKTTQLRYQSLKARLNTHWSSGGGGGGGGGQQPVISPN